MATFAKLEKRPDPFDSSIERWTVMNVIKVGNKTPTSGSGAVTPQTPFAGFEPSAGLPINCVANKDILSFSLASLSEGKPKKERSVNVSSSINTGLFAPATLGVRALKATSLAVINPKACATTSPAFTAPKTAFI